MKSILTSFIIICLIFSSSFLYAQQKNGRVEGTIKDAATGEVLPFATVSFVGTMNGAITNDKGFYRIGNVKPGSYKLKVTYISYTTTTVDVQLVDGQVLVQNVGLSFETTMGQEVTITAQAYGQVKAINTQIASRTIKNVVSEQKIRELPDANAAEALARLPGVSVERSGGEATSIKVRGVGSNTVYVNGMRMSGDLGAISSSMIGGIELSKAFMPDQDADVIGGSVDFKMREAPSGFKKEIWLSQGYNNFTKSFKMEDASLLLSNRFFKDKLGVMVGLSYDRKDRGRDNLNAGYGSVGSSPYADFILPVRISTVTLTKSQNLNTRKGLTIFTDYRLRNGRIYYQGFFSSFNGDNKSSVNTYGMNYNSNISTSFNNNIMNGIGGEYTILRAKIDWGISLSKSKTSTPDAYGFQSVGNSLKGVDDTTTTIQQHMAFGTNDLENTHANAIQRWNDKSYTNERGYNINIEIPYKFGNFISGYLKFGGKIRDIDRGHDYNNYNGYFVTFSTQRLVGVVPNLLPQYDWTLTPDKQLGIQAFLGSNPNATQDFSPLNNTKLYFTPDFNIVKQVAQALDAGNYLWPYLRDNASDYINQEKFYAGYIMPGIDIGKMITFTPGVRYEKDTYSTTAKKILEADPNTPISKQGTIEDITQGYHNTHFFPMVHLRIKPLKWFDIRMAYTNTVSRPDFSAMSPRYFKSNDNNIDRGNVFLRPQSNTNYDIYLSFYTGKIGLFTAGAFYKEMQDQVMYYTVKLLKPVNPDDWNDYTDVNGKILGSGFTDKNYSRPVNNKWPGYMKGVEFDWQTQFSYLPGFLKGFILNANVTFMQSTTRYPFFSYTTKDTTVLNEAGKRIAPYKITRGKQDSRINKILGMPDMVGNIALGYEAGGFSGRVSAYYQSATITVSQNTDISTDQSKAELWRFDIQLSQKIRKVEGLSLYLNIRNLTDNPDQVVLTHHTDRIVSEERYGAEGDVGIRYKF